MHTGFFNKAWILALLIVALATKSPAQCTPQWLPGAGVLGVDGTVLAMTMWDPDGPGPQPELLVVGGEFAMAGRVVANNIAVWDGEQWATLGTGFKAMVRSLTVLSTGELIAGGDFVFAEGFGPGFIARWNGQEWTPFGQEMNTSVTAMAILPDGDLIAVGWFTRAGTVAANHIARWHAQTNVWTPLGGGVNNDVYAVAVTPSGDVVVGGWFTTAGGIAAARIARWDGSSWHPIGSGITGADQSVSELTALSSGDILVGGSFTYADGVLANNVARWSPSQPDTFSALGGGFPTTWSGVGSFLELPDGSVLAGGLLFMDPDTAAVARWDGSSWVSLQTAANSGVACMVLRDNGRVDVGGSFTAAGGIGVGNVAEFHLDQPSEWRPLGTGTNGLIHCLAPLESGGVAAGGSFSSIGDVSAAQVATFEHSWLPLGSGVEPIFPNIGVVPHIGVFAIAECGHGGLVVAGDFFRAGGVAASGVASWNGLEWSAMGGGVAGIALSVAVMPDGGVIVGGAFNSAGGSSAKNIARWDGAAWSPLAAGTNRPVHSLLVLANGDLIAGGEFTTAGGVTANHIARWNGSTWTSLGEGLSDPSVCVVWTLAQMRNGDIVAGGGFRFAGGQPANRIAAWNGASWYPLGTGMDRDVTALAVLHNGGLVAGGFFDSAGGVPARRIAKWDTSGTWSAIDLGFTDPNSNVYALAVLADGDLAVGGDFTTVGGQTSAYFARWGCVCYPNCDSSTATPLLTANDFQCFMNAFVAMNSYANCDGSTVPPLLNANDFQCYLNKYASGCP